MYTAHLSVLWCHGGADNDIPISYANNAVAFLRNTVKIPSSKLHFRVYDDLGHTIHDNELSDVISWLQMTLR